MEKGEKEGRSPPPILISISRRLSTIVNTTTAAL